MTTLIVVESPTKAKALRKYLGSAYVVRASMGHVRDLPPKELGVDVASNYQPTYRLVSGARKVIAGLRSALDGCDTVILATDPDREGEAIAWHLAQALSKDLRGKKVLRARFHEITPAAVRAAVASPSEINMDLVNAQQARRVLDRLVGYQVSPVLWKGIDARGLSAGRVQSAALRLVVERDREIEAFVPDEYWTLTAELSKPNAPVFSARLWKIADKPAELKTEADANHVIAALDGADWRVGDIQQTTRSRKPYPPYITSTLQRDASTRLKWGAKKVMQVAQQLYEGVALPGEGQVGLITYMRTDSTNVSPEAQQAAREVIARFYGEDALPAKPPAYAKKVKNAQEAHEAIRPTDPARLPKDIRDALSPDQDKLYTLIWRRFIASQMKPARFHVTTVIVQTGRDGKPLPYLFRATGRVLIEPGFLKVYDVEEQADDDDTGHNASLPPLKVGDGLDLHRLVPRQHFTKPPARYTDASLIQDLEKLGVGRPSTFASIVDTLYKRSYVSKEQRSLVSTSLGRTVNDFLGQHFPSTFEAAFTAEMEGQLDAISNGEQRWTTVMDAMWQPLSTQLHSVSAQVATAPRIKVEGMAPPPARRKRGSGKRGGRSGSSRSGPGKPGKQAAEPAGRDCPRCGKPLVKRSGKYGDFVGCSGYPKCRYIEKGGAKAV